MYPLTFCTCKHPINGLSSMTVWVECKSTDYRICATCGLPIRETQKKHEVVTK